MSRCGIGSRARWAVVCVQVVPADLAGQEPHTICAKDSPKTMGWRKCSSAGELVEMFLRTKGCSQAHETGQSSESLPSETIPWHQKFLSGICWHSC